MALVSEIIKTAGDNPNVREAANNLGMTALTVTKTINNVLLPLAAINFAFDKARRYFSETFFEDISKKTAAIPPDQIVEPKASIAGPALQGLAFTHEEANLKEMYLNLIATAMDGRVAAEAHPAFVEIIKQLSPVEADILNFVLKAISALAIVEVRLSTAGQEGWRTLRPHLINLRYGDSDDPCDEPFIPAMVGNWIRLGLVEVDYAKHLTGEDSYKWVESRPEVLDLRQCYENDRCKLSFQNGIIVRTAFGVRFAKAVGLID
jgi:hypothetical protein